MKIAGMYPLLAACRKTANLRTAVDQVYGGHIELYRQALLAKLAAGVHSFGKQGGVFWKDTQQPVPVHMLAHYDLDQHHLTSAIERTQEPRALTRLFSIRSGTISTLCSTRSSRPCGAACRSTSNR